MGLEHETIDFGGQKVKGQGHKAKNRSRGSHSTIHALVKIVMERKRCKVS